MSHLQQLATSPTCCCCCEPEFDPALRLNESRHDALDSPSAPCIRVPSPLAWGRNNVRELRAQRRHVLGDRWWPWLDSNGVTLFVQQYDRGTCCELLLATNTWYMVPVPGIMRGIYAWSPYNTKKTKFFFLHGAAHKILHSYKEVQK